MKIPRGFTLMEVLVVLVMLALFTVLAYRALDAVTQSQRQVSVEQGAWREMITTFSRIESDLSNCVASLDVRQPDGSAFHTLATADGAMQFALLRLLPEDMDAGLLRVGYRCAQGRLERQTWPDPAPDAMPRAFPLLQGLRSCSFRYLGRQQQWLSNWVPTVLQPLPLAVELELVTADGTPLRRVWRVQ